MNPCTHSPPSLTLFQPPPPYSLYIYIYIFINRQSSHHHIIISSHHHISYLGFRLLYPIIWAVFGKGEGAPFKPYSLIPPFGGFPSLYYSTFPQYGIVFYMALATILKLCCGFCLNSAVGNPLLVAPLAFGWALYHYSFVLYPPLHNILAGAFK